MKEFFVFLFLFTLRLSALAMRKLPARYRVAIFGAGASLVFFVNR